jgi:hypothetical protein
LNGERATRRRPWSGRTIPDAATLVERSVHLARKARRWIAAVVGRAGRVAVEPLC